MKGIFKAGYKTSWTRSPGCQSCGCRRKSVVDHTTVVLGLCKHVGPVRQLGPYVNDPETSVCGCQCAKSLSSHFFSLPTRWPLSSPWRICSRVTGAYRGATCLKGKESSAFWFAHRPGSLITQTINKFGYAGLKSVVIALSLASACRCWQNTPAMHGRTAA